MDKIKFILLLIIAFTVSGCFYHDKSTDLDYMLHTDYEIFDISKNPNINFSNYVGFCMMPLSKPDDVRGQTCVNLLRHYLKKAGYVEVQREELIAEPALVPHSVLVGIGYDESYLYGTIQLEADVYKINEKGGGDLIWSWKAKFDGYPVCQKTIEPALEDLFELEPVNYDKKEKLYKKIKAPKYLIEEYMINLSKARRKLREASERGIDSAAVK